MPPVGNVPEQNRAPRFSPETIQLGNTILDGVSLFDEKKYSPVLRATMSARASGALKGNQTFKDMKSELQSYLMYRIKDEEQKEKDYNNARAKDDAKRIDDEDEKYRVKHNYEDVDQPELIKNEVGDWVRKDFL